MHFHNNSTPQRLTSIIFNARKWKGQRKHGFRDWELKWVIFFKNNTQHNTGRKQNKDTQNSDPRVDGVGKGNLDSLYTNNMQHIIHNNTENKQNKTP